jgi:rubredoxin
MKIAVIACDVLSVEVRHFCQELPQVKEIKVIEQGLHNTPDLLRQRLQEAIALTEEDAAIDTIVLIYGLCSRGIEGIGTQRCQLVVARAHDCITLLLGSKERYAEYIQQHPGTYWYSVGWNRCHVPPGKKRFDDLRREYLEKYGEENADYLMEMEQDWMRSYNRATFVDLGVTSSDAEAHYTKMCADWLGWSYDEQQGDPQLLRDLLSGQWDAGRFLVLRPGETIRFTVDDSILAATPCGRCIGAKPAS